jgi:hypothetical protein
MGLSLYYGVSVDRLPLIVATQELKLIMPHQIMTQAAWTVTCSVGLWLRMGGAESG